MGHDDDVVSFETFQFLVIHSNLEDYRTSKSFLVFLIRAVIPACLLVILFARLALTYTWLILTTISKQVP